MISIILVVIGLSALIIVHEWGHFLAARYFGLWVQEFGFGFPPRLFSVKKGETRYSFNAVPLGGFVKIFGENFFDPKANMPPEKSFAFQPPWKRVVVVVAGVIMNFLFGWLLFSLVLFIGSPSVILVDMVNDGSPADIAGLQRGDRIAGFMAADELISFISENVGDEIALNVSRGDETFPVQLTPRENPPAGEGALGLGLRDAGVPRHSFLEAIGRGFANSIAIMAAVVVGLYQAIFNPSNLIGPVGIFDVAISTGELGLVYLLQLLGLISLNLAVLNMLPIPALDGGRLLFIIIEKLRGKKFKPEMEMRANAIGFSLLILLIVAITLKDIFDIILF